MPSRKTPRPITARWDRLRADGDRLTTLSQEFRSKINPLRQSFQAVVDGRSDPARWRDAVTGAVTALKGTRLSTAFAELRDSEEWERMADRGDFGAAVAGQCFTALLVAVWDGEGVTAFHQFEQRIAGHPDAERLLIGVARSVFEYLLREHVWVVAGDYTGEFVALKQAIGVTAGRFIRQRLEQAGCPLPDDVAADFDLWETRLTDPNWRGHVCLSAPSADAPEGGEGATPGQMDEPIPAEHDVPPRPSVRGGTDNRPIRERGEQPSGGGRQERGRGEQTHTPPEPVTAHSNYDQHALAYLRLLTEGAVDTHLAGASKILSDESLTVNEKLRKIHSRKRIPMTISAATLGKMLNVSKQAIQKTDWWIQNRKGEKADEIGLRRAGHQDRAARSEAPNSDDD